MTRKEKERGRERGERNRQRKRRRENKTSERDRRMIWPSRTKERKKRSWNGRERQKETTSNAGREGEAKENMNAGDLGESSLTKTFHIFIFWGKARRGIFRARFMVLLLCLLLRQMLLLRSVRSWKRVVPAKGARLREDAGKYNLPSTFHAKDCSVERLKTASLSNEKIFLQRARLILDLLIAHKLTAPV